MNQNQNQDELKTHQLQNQHTNQRLSEEEFHAGQTHFEVQNNLTSHERQQQHQISQQEHLQMELRQHNQQKAEEGQNQNPYLQKDNYGNEINQMDFQNYQNKYQYQYDINQQRSVHPQSHYGQEQKTQNFENYQDYQDNTQIHHHQIRNEEQVEIQRQIILNHQNQGQGQDSHLIKQNQNQMTINQLDSFPQQKQNDCDSVNSAEHNNDNNNSHEQTDKTSFQNVQTQDSLQKKQSNLTQTQSKSNTQVQKHQNQQSKTILVQTPINQNNQSTIQKKVKQTKNQPNQTKKNLEQEHKNVNQTSSKKKKNKKQKSDVKNQTKMQNVQPLQNEKKGQNIEKTKKVEGESNQAQKPKVQTIQKKPTQSKKQTSNKQIPIVKQNQKQVIKQQSIKKSPKKPTTGLQKQNKGDKQQKIINNSSNSVSQHPPQQPPKNSDFLQKQQTIEVSQIKSQVPLEPIVPVNFIIKQAQKQRIGSTFQYFLKYMSKHDKHVNNQKKLISNIQAKVQAKKLSKYPIQSVMKDYFQTYISMCKDFHEKSYKFSRDQKIYSTNPLLNIRQELKTGFQQLIFQRKSTGNDYQRMSDFIQNVTLANMTKVFDNYWNGINLAQRKQKQKRDAFDTKQKQFRKRVAKVQKIYTKGRQGASQVQDVFVEMAKFIRASKQFRLYLIDWGRNLQILKRSVIKQQQQLLQDLQLLLNEFKNQTKSVYSLNRKQFTYIQKLDKFIRQAFTFANLSDLTDVDYVKSVLELNEKGENRQANDKDFQIVFEMNHFDNLVGNSNQLLKGTSSKIFQMKTPNEQLVQTISGNLVVFNRQKCQQKDKFITKNINVKIVGDGVIQIDELMKGIIFDSNRTVRITLRDNDRAEELIFFLNDDAQRESQEQKMQAQSN